MESFLLEDFWTPEVFDNVFKPLFNGGLEFLEQPFLKLCVLSSVSSSVSVDKEKL